MYRCGARAKLAALQLEDIPMSARHWSSNLLFLIIAIGTEAGIANVWKFSYLAGANGGGLFVALYFMALFLIAIPALMAEMMIGRHGGRSVPGTMQVLVDARRHLAVLEVLRHPRDRQRHPDPQLLFRRLRLDARLLRVRAARRLPAASMPPARRPRTTR